MLQLMSWLALAFVTSGSPAASLPLRCSVERTGPAQSTVEIARGLVANADRIVRAKAPLQPDLPPPRERFPTWWGRDTTLSFEVLETLKGDSLPRSVIIRGFLMQTDDFNMGSVPYAFVRRQGGKGDCFANGYRHGGEFLLLLREGTPYWAALQPTSEQVRGADDAWVQWVRAEVNRSR